MQARIQLPVILCVLLLQTVVSFIKRSERKVKSQYICNLFDLDAKSRDVAFKLKCDCQATPNTNYWTYACDGRLTGTKNIIQMLESERNFIEVLDLSMNGISKLRNDAFLDFEISNHITILRLSDNNIKKLPKPTFYPVKKLVYLDLSNNSLSFLPGNAFSRLQNLVTLRLDRNSISNLKPKCFNKLLNLEDLHLGHNQLRSLIGKEDRDSNRFENLENLKELYLNNNKLTKTFTALYKESTKLEYLDLSHNKIKSISNRAFVTFPNLRWLHLEGNPLSITNFESAFTGANLIFWFSVVDDSTTRWIEIRNGTGVTEPPPASQSTSIAFEITTESTKEITAENTTEITAESRTEITVENTTVTTTAGTKITDESSTEINQESTAGNSTESNTTENPTTSVTETRTSEATTTPSVEMTSET